MKQDERVDGMADDTLPPRKPYQAPRIIPLGTGGTASKPGPQPTEATNSGNPTPSYGPS